MPPKQVPPPLECCSCHRQYDVRDLLWRCPCGGVFDIAGDWLPSPHLVRNGGDTSLWRYRCVLPIDRDDSVSLGEGGTPMVRSRTLPGIRYKLDFLSPTASFKDRGAVVLATLAARLRVQSVLADSSGNAGVAAAAYFARAGIGCEVLVPSSTTPAKIARIEMYGARVTIVAGTRADTARAAEQRAQDGGVFYASHVYHPYFLHGVKTYGYEIWEQNGHTLPSAVLVPVGNGTLLLGCYLAFTELVEAGLADRLPALLAVQASACAPLATAFRGDTDTSSGLEIGPTVAQGIAISAPPRAAQILEAVHASGGTIVTVEDKAILTAQHRLASEGLVVEPTASVCFAAALTVAHHRGLEWQRAQQILEADDVVLALCGAGSR